MITRILILLLAMCSGAAAQTPGYGPTTPAAGSQTQVTATGTTTPRALGTRAADVVNVKDGYGGQTGAKGDAQIVSNTVTTTATSTDLVVGTAMFAQTDVGKTLIVGSAGTAPTTGPIMATPVTSSGSTYTAVPTCAITDSSGSGSAATCSALMSAVSATVATGGATCTNGAAVFLVGIDGVGTPIQLTGTVSGGVLSGTLTLTASGLYTTLPTLSGATAYGAGCATMPTINLTMGVGAVQVTAQGATYSTTQTTAALSGGGSPSPAAVMGGVVIGAVTPPLRTTISAYISSTHVTMADAAGSTLVASPQQVLSGTDDSAAFQGAINAGSGIYIPPGTYWIGTSLDPGKVTRSFRGEGKYNTILVFDGGTTAGQSDPTHTPLFVNRNGTPATPAGLLQFSNFQIRGILDFGRSNLGAASVELNNYVNLDFIGMRFYQLQYMAMAVESARHYEVLDSDFDTVMRDQARCRSCFSARIIGNHFIHSDDDSVAIHQANYINGAGIIGEGIVVTGNDFEDTTGVHLLHAWKAVVTGNTFRRVKVGAVVISNDATEGMPAQLGIVVADNQITDALARPPFAGSSSAVISVSLNPPAYATGDTNVMPGAPVRNTAYVAKPWDYTLSSTTSGAAPAPSGRGVTIHDNIYMRTLPATASYSAWGYGKVLTNYGFIDMPVPDTGLVPTAGISASINTPNLNIHSNTLNNLRRGISLNDNAVSASQVNISVSRNQIIDAWEYGIVAFGSGSAHYFSLIGNQIDTDPYQVSPGRSGGHGGWSSGYSASRCFSSGLTIVGFIMAENSFANCYAMSQPAGGVYYANTVFGKPAVALTGQLNTYATTNYGLGVYPLNSGSAFNIFQTQSDPTAQAPTSFEVLSASKTSFAAAAPTSGFHVIGDEIFSTAPGTCSCKSWLVLTTGSAWVSGTDYKVIPIQ